MNEWMNCLKCAHISCRSIGIELARKKIFFSCQNIPVLQNKCVTTILLHCNYIYIAIYELNMLSSNPCNMLQRNEKTKQITKQLNK